MCIRDRFEEAALKGSEGIVKNVEKISGAVKQANIDIARFGVGFAKSFTGMQGGILGFGKMLLDVSTNFKTANREMANIMVGISKGSLSYSRAITMSQDLMMKGSAIADRFAVDETALFGKTAMMGASLMDIKKYRQQGGTAQMAMESGLELSRASTKFATSVGLRPDQGTELVERMLTRTLNPQLRAWQTLQAKAGSEMKAAGMGTVSQVHRKMTQDPTATVEKLIKILDKFSGSSEALTDRVESVQGSMTRLRNIFFGFNSVFKEMSMVVNRVVRTSLMTFYRFINGPFRKTLERLGPVINDVAGRNRWLLQSFFELRDMADNFRKAKFFTTLIVILSIMIPMAAQFARWAMTFKVISGAVTHLTVWLQASGFFMGRMAGHLMALLIPGKGFLSFLGLLARFLIGGSIILAKYAIIFGALVTVFEGVTNATSRFKAKFISDITTTFSKDSKALKSVTEFGVQMTLLWRELTRLIGNAFFKLFSVIYDQITKLVKRFTGIDIGSKGGAEGAAAGVDQASTMVQVLRRIMHKGSKQLFGEGTIRPYEKEKRVPETVIQNANVTINQDFKGELNPDRVAFAFTKEVKRLSKNPVAVSARALTASDKSLARRM